MVKVDILVTNKTNKSGSCSVNIKSVRLFRQLGGGRYKQKTCSVSCCKVIDACTTSNDVDIKPKFVLNVMLEPNLHLNIISIPPPHHDVGMISRKMLILHLNFNSDIL